MTQNSAILLLPAALTCILMVLARRGAEWRQALVKASVIFGVLAALLTEALSLLHLLRWGVLTVTWAAVCSVALALRARRRPVPSSRIRWPGLFNGLLIAGIVAIEAIVGFTAILSPPNSADAMAYHMPRVVYWAQQGSVAFFPTPYYNQITLPPLSEYVMLHTHLLSGSDHFVNLVQFFGSLVSIAGVSLIAQAMGASRRGQIMAALFCATLPNAILQASGAKNDCLLACWLVAMVWYALQYRRSAAAGDLLGLGFALALALLTKTTAYLFAPPLLVAVLLPAPRRLWRAAVIVAGCVLLVNAPQYWRNLELSGSPLGFDSAHGDGVYRWRNEEFGWRPTLSNVLRNLSEQMGARSPRWNQGVYDAVVRAHRWLGIDPDDPRTSWPGEKFAPPRNSNHEANAHNRWHLLALIVAALPLGWMAWRSGRRDWLWYYTAILAGFLLFCFYLKWQPYLARLELPLFVLGAPIAGLLGERVRPALIQAALCLFLLNNSRPFLFENWTRPLEGPNSLLKTARRDNYFNDMGQWHNRASYLEAVQLTLRSGCKEVGVDISQYTLEYPYQALLLGADPSIRFVHTGVKNASARYANAPSKSPCAVLCLECGQNQEKISLYRSAGEPIQIGRFLLFLNRR